jgi:Ricin-type beta-trefoil lectin domain
LILDIDGTPIPQTGAVDIGSYQSPGNLPRGPVQLVARHSGKCLDVPESSMSAGTQIVQWGCWGGTNQQWLLTASDYTGGQITAVSSRMTLAVADMSASDGAAVIQHQSANGANEVWQLKPTSDGYYQIVVQHSGKCLDVAGGPDAVQDGALIQQWSCGGSINQQWQLVPLI